VTVFLVVGLLAVVRPAASQASPPRILGWVETLTGTEEQALRWPVAVAASPGGKIGIADAFGSRLFIFRRVGVSSELDRVVELPGPPAGLAHDGERFVVALRSGGLRALEGSTASLRELPVPPGVVPGTIAAAGDGEILVFDAASQRILVLSGNGTVRRDIEVGRYVSALAPGSQGRIFAAVPEPPAVLAFDSSGRLEATWQLPGEGPTPAWPMGIAAEPGGDVLVSDRHGARILVLNASGQLIGLGSRRGWEPGLLRFPGALSRLATGELVVADQGNARVQIFRRTDRSTGR
jgi:hypothetical protein